MATLSTLQPVTAAFAQDFEKRYTAAWNAHQPERLLSMMTEDVLFEDPSWAVPMRGHAAVREFLVGTWRAVPDLRIELTDGPLVDPRKPLAASSWRASGTHTGPWDPPGLDATGRPISFDGVDLLEFRDEKICRARAHYDVAAIMRQLGVLPPQRSRGERTTMLLANVATRIRKRRHG